MGLSRDVMVNHDEVRKALDESRLDALIAVSPENTFYFSGVFIRTQVSIRERLALVVVPRQREETFIVCNIEESLARSQGWLRDVRTYVEFAQSPLEVLAQVLRERGLAEGRLGVEERYLSAAYYRGLQQQLPQADLVAADRLFTDIRNIKTPAQVELFTSAFQWTEQAVWNAWTASKPGESEKIVAERMVQEMVKAGADGPRHMTLAVARTRSILTLGRAIVPCVPVIWSSQTPARSLAATPPTSREWASWGSRRGSKPERMRHYTTHSARPLP